MDTPTYRVGGKTEEKLSFDLSWDVFSPVKEHLYDGTLEYDSTTKKIMFARKHPKIVRDDFILENMDRMPGLMRCQLWHSVVFDMYGILPSYCMDCWKVVARPKTLKELLRTYQILLNLERPGKCGIERRPTVRGHYGAYWYNRGLEAGLDCYKAVREAVTEDIGEHMPVILKRACTEYEIREPGKENIFRSDLWEPEEGQIEKEKRIKEAWDIPEDVTKTQQTDEVKTMIFHAWLVFAWERDDPTFEEIYGRPLYPKYVTYHEDTYDGDVEWIKAQLQRSREGKSASQAQSP